MPRTPFRPALALLVLLPLLLATACAPAGDPGADPGDGGAEAPAADSATENGATESSAADSTTAPAHPYAGPIEEAQGKAAWFAQEAVAFDMVLNFGGNTVLDGTVTFTPNTAGSRIELANGTVAGWDGSSAWVSPADAEFPRARFHVLTWPYFLAAPFKLTDPGANLELLGEREIQGETYDAARLTFDAGTGDTPDDWYVLYRDRETNRLAAMAYIVTYGTPRSEAEEEPHAITYTDFQTVDGVTLPTSWGFWLWSEEEGIHGDPLGDATLSGLRFVDPAEGAFAMPEDARQEGLPGAE